MLTSKFLCCSPSAIFKMTTTQGRNTLKSLNTRQSYIQLMNKKTPNTNCSRKTPSQFCQKIKNFGGKNENCTDPVLYMTILILFIFNLLNVKCLSSLFHL